MTGAQAYGAWVPAAKEILLEAGQQQPPAIYNYDALAWAIQASSGISAGQVPVADWVGRVLDQLSVQPDGAELLRLVRKPVGTDKSRRSTPTSDKRKLVASNKTLADKPTKSKAKAEAVELEVCPIHFLQLSASGQCSECE